MSGAIRDDGVLHPILRGTLCHLQAVLLFLGKAGPRRLRQLQNLDVRLFPALRLLGPFVYRLREIRTPWLARINLANLSAPRRTNDIRRVRCRRACALPWAALHLSTFICSHFIDTATETDRTTTHAHSSIRRAVTPMLHCSSARKRVLCNLNTAALGRSFGCSPPPLAVDSRRSGIAQQEPCR